MKIKIIQRSVYHKYAEKEYQIDSKKYLEYIEENGRDENGEPYHDIQDYILDNEDFWVDDMDSKINESEFIFGSGVNEYNGMTDATEDSEWRYECEELKMGGHL